MASCRKSHIRNRLVWLNPAYVPKQEKILSKAIFCFRFPSSEVKLRFYNPFIGQLTKEKSLDFYLRKWPSSWSSFVFPLFLPHFPPSSFPPPQVITCLHNTSFWENVIDLRHVEHLFPETSSSCKSYFFSKEN